jgi:hypothetical protein
MFSLFEKKINLIAIEQYWIWFLKNEQWIIENYRTNGMEVVYAIDRYLKPIFPVFKGEIEFDFTFDNGKGEFNFYDLRKKYLLNGASELKEKMPPKIKERWIFNISH